MPPFKDEQILIIAPGSQTTLAQLGLPESLTPPRLHIRSCMFRAEQDGEYEPYKVRQKESAASNGIKADATQQTTLADASMTFEEDVISEEGAIWPMKSGSVTDWPCFFALINHVYNTINPPFHTPILLIAEPVWTPKEHEKITQFFFEKFKTPAFALMDAAMATSYAYGLPTATVVDVGADKADVTAVSDFLLHTTGRALAVPDCGGEAMTQRLVQLLGGRQGFSREMCEQLKRSPICEILPPDVDLPNETRQSQNGVVTNPAAAASTGADGSGPGQRNTPAAAGDAPLGPGEGTEVGVEGKEGEDNEGVLDIASIVTGGKMNEYLERKEKEKQEKAIAKKKGLDAAAAAKPQRSLPNSKRVKNTFQYEDFALRNALKDMNVNGKRMAEMEAAMNEAPNKRQKTPELGVDEDHSLTDASTNGQAISQGGLMRRELEVGPERFQAASGGVLEKIADAVYRTISSVEEINKRSELWDSLVIVGNGSKVRGFKEALLATLSTKYLISPSSATIFTSELPSNMSTPLATGMNTPQPQLQPHAGSHVNPLLLAATTAQNPHLNPMGQSMPHMSHSMHSSHAQTPTSVKLAKVPDYFPEWKDVGYEEAMFLGAQVAAKVLFITDAGLSKGYMTRTDYNDQGPQGIHDYSM